VDAFIKLGDRDLLGKAWPSEAVFPDFFNPKTVTWWQQALTDMHNEMGFDGLWEDMNEASDFCDGVCYAD
jgi:alpha-D-xyloside xylohydrolase